MTVRDTVTAAMTKRHPSASADQLDALSAAWIESAGSDAEFYSSQGLEIMFDIVAKRIEDAVPELIAAIPKVDAPVIDEKTTHAPTPFSKLDPGAQREEVAKRFGLGDPANVLPLKFAALRDAIIAEEARVVKAARPPVTAPIKAVNGLGVTSKEFLALDPAKRIELVRAAARGE